MCLESLKNFVVFELGRPHRKIHWQGQGAYDW